MLLIRDRERVEVLCRIRARQQANWCMITTSQQRVTKRRHSTARRTVALSQIHREIAVFFGEFTVICHVFALNSR